MVALVQSMSLDHPAKPVLVISNRPGVAGLSRANDLGVPTACVDHKAYGSDRLAFEADLNGRLLDADPDIICLAGFMRILSASFIENWQGKMLNIHPSLLPKYKGLHTHERALEAGDAEHGCTVHEVTADLDDGPILGQAKLPILADDTPDTLAARLLPLEHKLYPLVLRNFALGIKTRVDVD